MGRVQQLLPRAELHTPYGMTEALPVADIALAEIESVGAGPGVCVGRPLPGVEVRLSPLAADGSADGALTSAHTSPVPQSMSAAQDSPGWVPRTQEFLLALMP